MSLRRPMCIRSLANVRVTRLSFIAPKQCVWLADACACCVRMSTDRVVWCTLMVLLISLCALPTQTRAADEVVHFDNPDHKSMYQDLLKHYRCLKCQNQNLWDSNASLAGDLRREIREQILAGKNQSDIDTYLVARYGEFVLYKPRFNSTTAVLWIGPFALLFIALVASIMMVRGKSAKASAMGETLESPVHTELQDAGKLAKARDLLKD